MRTLLALTPSLLLGLVVACGGAPGSEPPARRPAGLITLVVAH